MWRIMLAMLLLPNVVFAEVGNITENSGPPAEVKRDDESFVAEQGFSVEMLDTLITANSRLAITFEDDSRVEVTEQTQFQIDEFVYDPNTDVGKVSMKVALGTAQLTSGRIAHKNNENVSITTPTASITVRGTDFSMTVDEFGRSLIILLPSCPDKSMDPDECPVGSIEVKNDAGAVLLDEKFEGTMVRDSNMLPTDPRKLLLDGKNIDNGLIIVPPSEFPNGFSSTDNDEDEIQTAMLDVDYLEYKDLEIDLLTNELDNDSELDINRLNNAYLDNLLDLNSDIGNDELAEKDGILPTVKNYSWIQSAYNDEAIYLESDRQPHIFNMETTIDTQGTLELQQDEYKATIIYNDGGTDVNIKVVQKQ